ncbi:MAG: pantetheine-phosphate adenylyltransferase [Bacilli bacterium]|nr:pantetheine-phosphate adenylyltransferase [Bacilli bacterium]MBO6286871.1 pantetheine-phosphate adenylyltransferase [Bacilli bacterium]
MNKAIYPGSFDPFTNGHLDILNRACKVFDEVIVLVAINPAKKTVFTVQERVDILKKILKDKPNVRVDSYEGLTVDYAKQEGVKHIIRGLRAVTDFEYEFQLASANRFANPEIDMVFFMASVENSFVSSSVVNELRKNGADVSPLVPKPVVEAFEAKGI